MGGEGGCTGERAGSEQGSGMSWERSAGDSCAGKGLDGRSKGCLYNTMAKLLLRCCRRNWHRTFGRERRGSCVTEGPFLRMHLTFGLLRGIGRKGALGSGMVAGRGTGRSLRTHFTFGLRAGSGEPMQDQEEGEEKGLDECLARSRRGKYL